MQTDNAQAVEFGTVCGMNLVRAFRCGFFLHPCMLVCCGRQRPMSSVLSWGMSLVLSAHPLVVATAVPICAEPLVPK